MAAVYEFKGKPHPDKNNQIIRVDNKKDAIVRIMPHVRIEQRANKYKLLVISTEADLVKFNKLYGTNTDLKWNVLMQRYGGVALDLPTSVQLKYFMQFKWIDYVWYTNYGFVWRFKLKA